MDTSLPQGHGHVYFTGVWICLNCLFHNRLCCLDVSVLSLERSVKKQPVLPLGMPVLHHPVLPLNLSILHCTAVCAVPGTVCHTAACAVSGHACSKQPVCSRTSQFYSSQCCSRMCLFYYRICCLEVSDLQQPVLPVDVYVLYQLCWTYMYGHVCSTADCAVPNCLFYSSLIDAPGHTHEKL
jgi:hypothetical protein